LDDVSRWVVGVVGHMKVDVIVLVHHVQRTSVRVIGVKKLRGPRSLEVDKLFAKELVKCTFVVSAGNKSADELLG
jgi:hypothetical protein